MITVFGFLGDDDVASACVEVKFDGGPNGGQVTYTLCEGIIVQKILAPNSLTKALCVQDQSWTFGDFFMSAQLIGPCDNDEEPPFSDNVFLVERTTDGFSTYAEIPANNTFGLGDTVNIDGDIECYEIMGFATVGDPTLFPMVISSCVPGGGGGPPPPPGGGGDGPPPPWNP